MKRKYNKGFTMAEMLAVVALILILMAVAAVGVARYRRSMRQLEYDAIAKEMFIAAQNHLTMADNQGLVGAKANSGTKDTAEEGEVCYFVYPGTSPNDDDSALSLMLPYGAVDETARTGGSYVIIYEKSSALVLDVFYSDPGDQTGLLGGLGCTFKDITDEEYTALKGYRGDGQKDNRQHYPGKDNNNAVIGWYGGDGLGEEVLQLKAPSIQIINAERLEVKYTNPNTGVVDDTGAHLAQLQLIITQKGDKSVLAYIILPVDEAEGYFVLDSIVKDEKHFADLFSTASNTATFNCTKDFTPGADIEIKAVAYSNSKLANIAQSATLTTNSLFASLETDGTVNVSNIRHLENLDGNMSGFNDAPSAQINAKQTSDLDWEGEWTAPDPDSPETKEYWPDKTITPKTGSNNGQNSFYPVLVDYKLDYDGQSHSISNVVINTSGDAGVFGKITAANCSIKNLELIDFNVESTGGNAGALLGTGSATIEIENVLARNSKDKDSNTAATITASGDAGGLIGNLTGGTVSYSAAALIVHSDSGSAGGLIGSAAGGTVTGCYAGGHAEVRDNKYIDGTPYAYSLYVGYSDSAYNVTGVTAGGLIGESKATVKNSYSTCSVSGTSVAGGFVGSVTGGDVENCYCTGLVAPERDANNEIINNAFLGSGSVTGSNLYYEIVNELVTFDTNGNVKEIEYKGAGNAPKTTPFDLSFDPDNKVYGPDVFNDFIGSTSDWTSAKPYNSQLSTYYAGKYNLKSLERLTGTSLQNYFVRTHYGDWPSPELFFVNSGAASS